MKNFIKTKNLIILGIIIIMSSCSKKEVVYNDETEYFETKKEILYYKVIPFDGKLKEYFKDSDIPHLETSLISIKSYSGGKLDGITERYDNGVLDVNFSYKDGYRDGLQEEYFENGQVHFKYTYKDGYEDGLFEEYFENGQLRFKKTYRENEEIKESGVWTEYFEDGKIKFIEEYDNNGDPSGKWEFYSQDGSLLSKYNYVNGQLNGEIETFYEDNWGGKGFLKEKGSYLTGKKDGFWEENYSSGRPKSKINYSNGILNGSYVTLYEEPNDTHEKGNYINGKKDGEWTTVSKYINDYNNELIVYVSIGSYFNGEKIGKWSESEIVGGDYSEEDSKLITSKGSYKNGKKDGEWESYFGDGYTNEELFFRGNYENGELLYPYVKFDLYSDDKGLYKWDSQWGGYEKVR
jgi:antitoxin component YwqK of YwqJK toxin-antitoxin module